ncbi:MAG TPA: 3'(2'),5'-bisphosphate nucleotidase CysQ [Pseudolabrys sp.]|nr:3'(2'),5'-bisphosphate nucleotidase CysQ [Pseudolabrys sp.]
MDDLTCIVARAAACIRAVSPETVEKRQKDDLSPVTAADEASEAAILEGLARLRPDVPVVSEERAVPQSPARIKGSFFIVDPLDGTKEFLKGSDEFAVLLGIVTDGVPIAGLVAGPKQKLVWRGVVGHGAERLRLLADGATDPQRIRARAWPGPSAVAMVSRSHYDAKTDAFLKPFGRIGHESCGSALKFALIAEGRADLYPRLGTTCEWDVAAGHALVTAAGGTVLSPEGAALQFGCVDRNFRMPAFVAWGDPAKAAAMKP